jgi:hypothetical protein
MFEIGRIIAWEPGVRLAFTWRQATFTSGKITEVEVRFESVGNETRLTVEHRGWETVPLEHVARHGFPDTVFLRRHAEWWQVQLANIGAWCPSKPAPDATGVLQLPRGHAGRFKTRFC